MRKADKIFHKLDAHESEVKHPAILLCWKLKKSRRHLPAEPVAEVFVDMVWMNSVTFSPPNEFIDLDLSSHQLHREPDIKHLPLFHLPFPLIWNQILQTPPLQVSPPMISISGLNWKGIFYSSHRKKTNMERRRNEDAYLEFLCKTV